MRFATHTSAWEVRGVASLEEAATLLNPEEEIILGLPMTSVLAQRLHLPPAEAEELHDIIRLQVEKTLPYPPEEVTADYEVIEKGEEGSVISAVAIHNAKLHELAAPLLSKRLIPTQVTVYGAQRASTHAPTGTSLLIYPERENTVCAITEHGKLSFTRSFNGAVADELQRDLPQIALTAELEGINTDFNSVLLDESLFPLREMVENAFGRNADLVAVEAPPAAVKLNLLPDSWRRQRLQLIRFGQWRKRLIWAALAYVALLALLLVVLGIFRMKVKQLERRIARDEPNIEFVRKTEATWKALSPAIDPRFYPIEVLLHLHESLPSQDVHITAYNQSARQISVDGEANSAALAYQFVEKVKKNAGLQGFNFDMPQPPRILPNEHAQFRLEGRPK